MGVPVGSGRTLGLAHTRTNAATSAPRKPATRLLLFGGLRLRTALQPVLSVSHPPAVERESSRPSGRAAEFLIRQILHPWGPARCGGRIGTWRIGTWATQQHAEPCTRSSPFSSLPRRPPRLGLLGQQLVRQVLSVA